MANLEKQMTKAKLWSAFESTLDGVFTIIIKNGKIIKKRKNNMIKKLYTTPTKRIAMRLIEIFVLTGIAGVFAYILDVGMLPFYGVPIVEALLKAVREYLKGRE